MADLNEMDKDTKIKSIAQQLHDALVSRCHTTDGCWGCPSYNESNCKEKFILNFLLGNSDYRDLVLNSANKSEESSTNDTPTHNPVYAQVYKSVDHINFQPTYTCGNCGKSFYHDSFNFTIMDPTTCPFCNCRFVNKYNP